MKHLRNPWRRLTPRELVARQLADAEIERLEYLSALERYGAHCEMLERRIARLRVEMRDLDREEDAK